MDQIISIDNRLYNADDHLRTSVNGIYVKSNEYGIGSIISFQQRVDAVTHDDAARQALDSVESQAVARVAASQLDNARSHLAIMDATLNEMSKIISVALQSPLYMIGEKNEMADLSSRMEHATTDCRHYIEDAESRIQREGYDERASYDHTAFELSKAQRASFIDSILHP